jgi:hypothetical protein
MKKESVKEPGESEEVTEYRKPKEFKETSKEEVKKDAKECKDKEGHKWVRGGTDDENKRYGKLLEYMEEKREEARRQIKESDEKKEEAKKKKARWDLMRESMEFLRSNSDKWQERKILECERIRQEEKEDRLAVIKVKKKRYGIGKLSRKR